MNKLLISIAAAGLGALAFTPAVIAQDSSSSEPPAMASGNVDANTVSTEDFDKADLDNNGELSFDEAVSVLPTLTQEAFARLDGNGNGTLSLAEIGDTPKDGSLLSPPPKSSELSSEEPAPAPAP